MALQVNRRKPTRRSEQLQNAFPNWRYINAVLELQLDRSGFRDGFPTGDDRYHLEIEHPVVGLLQQANEARSEETEALLVSARRPWVHRSGCGVGRHAPVPSAIDLHRK